MGRKPARASFGRGCTIALSTAAVDRAPYSRRASAIGLHGSARCSTSQLRNAFTAYPYRLTACQVGAVFALEVSRLARSNLDWHRLLELCALTATLVIDEDGCYDPSDFNDGLLLGLNRPDSQSTSCSTFRFRRTVGTVFGFLPPRLLCTPRQPIPSADVADVLCGKGP